MSTDLFTPADLLTDPGLRRLLEVASNYSDPDDPMAQALAQLTVVFDEFMAQMLRNERAGRGKSLREQGFTATADVLAAWPA